MATVVKPDNNEYQVLGNMTLTGDLFGLGNLNLNESLTLLSENNIDLSTPVNGTSALNVSGGAYFAKDVYVQGSLVVNGDIITLGNSQTVVSSNIGIDSSISEIVNSSNTTISLPSGENGQIKYIVVTEPLSENKQIIPTLAAGFVSITLTSIGDSVTLVYNSHVGWIITSKNNVSVI